MRVELADCTNTLLREIGCKETKRKDVAQTYALAMRSTVRTDWAAVNKAIVARWSLSALQWIKEQAHSGKCFDEPCPDCSHVHAGPCQPVERELPDPEDRAPERRNTP